ncbi:MAG: T9SS type A sorting domain-containing protein [Bacteroidetes bacterium]|nr:T9SS type A sorting domain-containing protein [Bacteroidota bacterium]MCL2301822.1 T9SS type A sorting domain-containing protein [Lentimicrobiaceae bacterium]
MKRNYNKIKIYLLLFAISFTFFTVNAQQKLYVRLKDNTQVEYNVSNVQKLTFPSGNLVVTTHTGNIAQTPLTEVRFLAFQNFPVGIVETLRAMSLQVYPNPVTSELQFSTDNFQHPIEQINIYDLIGRQVLNYQFPTSHSISVSSLKAGIYFLEIRSGNERAMQKFVKL